MERYLGRAVVELFTDDDVTEIYANADGLVRTDTHARGKVRLGVRLRSDQIEQFLNAVATREGVTLNRSNPTIQAELPDVTFRGARLQGFIPPVTSAATLVLRKRAVRLYDLASYVEAGTMTDDERQALVVAVGTHQNVLVCGGTGSGKTTLCNALIQQMTAQFPRERFVILEDTAELQCDADDHLQLQTTEGLTLSDLVKHTLRCAPDRIIVGEVRDGAALDLLDAWATGHPGGCATVHATTAAGALLRMNRLAQRAGVPPQHELIAESVDLVVVIQGGTQGRRVTEMVRVGGQTDGRFDLEPVRPRSADLAPTHAPGVFPKPALSLAPANTGTPSTPRAGSGARS
ncbi:P-type conjugative transfer ATPase TrbB [Rubrivirga litoralis]|uniref:P-type conjugative transfer ATPase TrbB n=1 Tax=Rubrivirga litoralis TaxID=3075598 RepID=A0ABU3BUH6_9BACT|nr:P-type conjugative transfer ATPase TrbB [Rubrivirga sp. F394]MDT0632953.1 P-type conjugative transfer ATPase TrbB [Rubrivirga sp. F394]